MRLSVVFYALLGGLNLLVAFNASERTWVNFKLFGLTAATVMFAALQLAWLARHLPPPKRRSDMTAQRSESRKSARCSPRASRRCSS